MGPHAMSQALSTRYRPHTPEHRREQIGVGVVARTNRGVAQAGISRAGHNADLPRNNLPQSVHSNPRGAQEGITGASPIPAQDAACTKREHGGSAARAD